MEATISEGGAWFKEWFGSPYYKLLYSHRDTGEARLFVENLVKRVGLSAGDRVLDLACGRGRHSVELHRLGLDVVGIDISEESIAEASSHSTDGLRFMVHDMRTPFPVSGLDAVLNLFTSFGYFHSHTDDLLTVRAVADALREGGVFIIDFLNVEKTVREMVQEEELVRDGVAFHIRRHVTDGIITKEIEVDDRGRTFRFREEVDALTLPDFEGYFKDAGLRLVATFGDYALGPFDVQESERLIMLTEKVKA